MAGLPKAVLFDLDDTLICFEGVGQRAWDECCARFVTEEAPAFTEEALLGAIDRTREWYWSDPERHRAGRMDLARARREMVRLALGELGLCDDAAAARLADAYSALRRELICLFPETLCVLDTLCAHGAALALLTNGAAAGQRAKIERFGLAPYFAHILIEQEVGFGKPDPRMYREALKRLGLSPADVWMVGDNPVWDIRGAQELGIYAVLRENPYQSAARECRDRGIVPDRVICALTELTDDFIQG